MTKEEKLKLMYEKAIEQHRFFLGWRDKLLAGYAIILGTFIYFLADIEEHFDNPNRAFIVICFVAMVVIVLFLLLSIRNTVLYWQCCNTAYSCEQVLAKNFGFEGLYSLLTNDNIKSKIEDLNALWYIKKNDSNFCEAYKYYRDKLYSHSSVVEVLKLKDHTGIINWIYILSFLGFFVAIVCKIHGLVCCGGY